MIQELEVKMIFDVPTCLRMTVKYDPEEQIVQEITSVQAEYVALGGQELMEKLDDDERLRLDCFTRDEFRDLVKAGLRKEE